MKFKKIGLTGSTGVLGQFLKKILKAINLILLMVI